MADAWNDKTIFPKIGTKVVVKYDVGADQPYGLFDVKDYDTLASIISNVDIVAWQYLSFFETTMKNKSTLSGFQEGTNNDWAGTTDGYIQQEKDIYMLRQQINARVQTLPNEVDGFDGVDYMNVIFGSTSVEQKAAVLSDVIQNIPAVKTVTFINATWVDKVAGIFKFTFNIQSLFGDLSFSMGIDLQNRKILAEN